MLSNLPVTSREYKILLNSGKFTDMEAGIAGFCSEIRNVLNDLEGNFTEYRETFRRMAWYLDTPKSELKKHNYILRIREEPDSNKRFKITLKYRHSDRYLSASKDLTASMRFKHKFEEDILPPYISKFSHSASIKKNKLPDLNTAADAVEIFHCLEELGLNGNSDLISPNGFTAFETTYWIGAFDFENNGNINACLNFWHKSNKRKGVPLIAEFSFDYNSAEVNENEPERYKLINVLKSYELFLRLQKMYPWISKSPSATKTHLAYNIL